MGKVDTAGIEFLEGDGPLVRAGMVKTPVSKLEAADPFSRVVRTRQSVKVPLVSKRKAVKKPVRSFEGVSSLRLVGELSKRHYVDLQVLGFWLAIALIVWIKLG